MIKKIALATAVAVIAMLSLTTPAQADDLPWWQNCPSGDLCFYTHLSTGYEFPVVEVGMPVGPPGFSVGDCINFYDEDPGSNYEDQIEAWANNWTIYPPVYVQFYTDRDCDDTNGATYPSNQVCGEMVGGIVILGISSARTMYNP